MYAIGIDPDLHNTAIAEVELDETSRFSVVRVHAARVDPRYEVELDETSRFSVVRVHVARVDPRYKGEDAVRRMAQALYEILPWSRRSPGDLPEDLHDPVVVVEGQEIYRGKTGNPDDILRIAQVAGAALASCGTTARMARFPRPKEWKGSVPKVIHQARTARKVGWTVERRGGKDPYCVPTLDQAFGIEGARGMNPSDWKHVLDAIGLACWGLEQDAAARRRTARRAA